MEIDDRRPDHLGGSDSFVEQPSVEELEERIAELEERTNVLEKNLDRLTSSAATSFYVLGTAIAVVLSWSRSASILWCILHGVFSWAYVVYFAFTR